MVVPGVSPSLLVLSAGPQAPSACDPTGHPCLSALPLDHRSSPAYHARGWERRGNKMNTLNIF